MAPLHPPISYAFRLTRTTFSTSLLPARNRQSTFRCYASQSYGGGEGDPRGESPQKQGSSPATSDAEHPGPSPPDVGKGTGGGPTKKGSSGHGGKDTMGSSREGSKQTSGGGPLSEAAAQPKIHKHETPHPDTHTEDVRAHNAEVAKRRDKPHEGSSNDGDRVDGDYWKGEFSIIFLRCGGLPLTVPCRARRRRQRSMRKSMRYQHLCSANSIVMDSMCLGVLQPLVTPRLLCNTGGLRGSSISVLYQLWHYDSRSRTARYVKSQHRV